MSGWVARKTAGDQTSPEKTKIILVDDEPDMIKSKKALIEMGVVDAWQGWEILYATSAEEALGLFAQHPDVTHIVADRSVGTGGVHVLEQIATYIKDHTEEQRAFKGAVVYSWRLGDDPKEAPLAIEGMNIVRVPNDQPVPDRLYGSGKLEKAAISFDPKDSFARLPAVEQDPWYAKIATAMDRVNEMAARNRTPA